MYMMVKRDRGVRLCEVQLQRDFPQLQTRLGYVCGLFQMLLAKLNAINVDGHFWNRL
jgi:hypothetical protein